jgi:hypothetical protein
VLGREELDGTLRVEGRLGQSLVHILCEHSRGRLNIGRRCDLYRHSGRVHGAGLDLQERHPGLPGPVHQGGGPSPRHARQYSRIARGLSIGSESPIRDPSSMHASGSDWSEE